MTKQREIKFRAWDKEKKVMVVLVYDKYWKRYNRSKKMINIGEEVFSSGKTKIDANDFYIQLDGTIIRTRDYASPATGEYGDKIGGDDVWNIEYKEVSDRYILMQYTGLKDKNGKEIYEGDIVEFHYGSLGSFREEIIFNDGGFWILRKDGSNFMPSIEFREVIGNIYENKDLLQT